MPHDIISIAFRMTTGYAYFIDNAACKPSQMKWKMRLRTAATKYMVMKVRQINIINTTLLVV
jgi:hypothetical protein